jgi:hypothetical protein
MSNKKIIFTLLLAFQFTNSNAQTNLEFSQIFNRFYPYTTTTSSQTYELVVPQGKVLKITSATVIPNRNAANYTNGESNVHFMIDGHLLAYYEASSYNPDNFNKLITNSPFPLWLSEGRHNVQINTYYATIWGTNYGCSFSGILFNLTQE